MGAKARSAALAGGVSGGQVALGGAGAMGKGERVGAGERWAS